MARHYSTKSFFRQIPNALLARYFGDRGLFEDLDFTAMKETVFVNIVVALTYAALFKSDRSFSGFNHTFLGKSQFRIAPLHRFG